MLLQKAKRDKSIAKSSSFTKECRVHPDFLAVLASDRELEELVQFCTDPQEYSIFCADPTFNIFEDNISLTVTTYINLTLENKATNQPPVFIGPLIMHQHKDWKTYSRFANSLMAEQMELDTLLARGTDGEKALIDRFQQNFRFATFLRCFIHFKGNIKTELKNRNISSTQQKLYMQEIFGKQEGTTKFYGLVDSESTQEFDQKLEGLKNDWNNRESGITNITRKGRLVFGMV